MISSAAPVLVALVGMLGGLHATSAVAGAGAELGVLTCNTVPGSETNLLLYSGVDVCCVFKHTRGTENYRGKTGIALGADINWKREQSIAFTVLGGASDWETDAHALAGNYLGARARSASAQAPARRS